MAIINYQNNVQKAVKILNEICTNQNMKLVFIKEIFETDGAANMNFDLDKLNSIMSLIAPSSLLETSTIKEYFYNNLNLISKCDSFEDLLVLFKSNQDVIDEFCVSYLTFKQFIDFVDNEKTRLIKIQNAIAKQIADYVSESLTGLI
ncbi:DUF1951 domain-containing protein [Mycoplasmoides alvi]|uniref:DUF1951 domain-containing protein n=1 Tax=Mycoplasmoides alvi TaxID=78580 RepID=UPI00051BFC2F|nr:DUF1951 domain-containing protein [Mycoplasmoides alvi]